MSAAHNTPIGPRVRRKESRAFVLLRRLVATHAFNLDAIAHTLAVSEATLNTYLSESTAIPLPAQLRLASFVIKRVPTLAGLGHRLRGQAAAAIFGLTRVANTASPVAANDEALLSGNP